MNEIMKQLKKSGWLVSSEQIHGTGIKSGSAAIAGGLKMVEFTMTVRMLTQ